MNYKEHRAKWNGCTACSLCETRHHVVLARGDLPCSILFVGEAPGTSENDTGQPFTGPAGHLLDLIIARALMKKKVSIAFTNLVACIPLGDDGKKVAEPSVESIEACRERLTEIIVLAKPKGIVLVGKLAEKYVPLATERLPTDGNIPKAQWAYITHPAAILRAEKQNQGLLVQTCVVTVRDLIEEIGF